MKKSLILISAFIFILSYSAFSQFPKYLYGIISWYGDDYAGKKTASGEIYDPNAYTAAHQILPFGTELEVENLENGKKVHVRINDRGPLVENRVLDVSKKAAEDLGIIKKGTVYAKITMIKLGDNKVNKESSSSSLEAAESSTSSAPASANTVNSNQQASIAVQPNAVSSAPAAASTASTVPGQNPPPKQAITVTNVDVIYLTNSILMTNYVSIPVTNVIDLPPYQDKLVEKDVTGEKRPAPVIKNEDQFVMDEPLDIPPMQNPPAPSVTPAETNKAIIIPPAEKKSEVKPETIPAVESNTNEIINYNEVEVTPETLLSNETAVKLEQNQIKGEAFLESQKKEEKNINYVIQVGAFTKESYALSLYDKLKKNGYQVYTTENPGKKGKIWIRVRVGHYPALDKAKTELEKIQELKIKGMIVKVKS